MFKQFCFVDSEVITKRKPKGKLAVTLPSLCENLQVFKNNTRKRLPRKRKENFMKRNKMKKKLNYQPQFVTLDFPNPLQRTATSGP